jgi:hypothetical protein
MPTRKRATSAQARVRRKLAGAAKAASRDYAKLPPNMRTRARFGKLVKEHYRHGGR